MTKEVKNQHINNAVQSGASVALVALSQIVARLIVAHGWMTADTENWLVIVLTGLFVWLTDYIRHLKRSR